MVRKKRGVKFTGHARRTPAGQEEQSNYTNDLGVRKKRTSPPYKKKEKTCFNCGKVTSMSVQTKQKKGRVFICQAKACWDKYWKELPQK